MEEARNDSSLALDKVKSKNEVILEAQRNKKKVHFATLMDICHLKNCGVGTEISKSTKAGSCSGRTL